MTEAELIAFRQLFHNMLVAELTVRNTVLLETLKLHMTGNNDATIQDGILLTVSLLEEMSERNEKIFQGNLEAQMLADECRETVERLKGFATGISYPKNA